ncbi:MAG: YihY/virulence factor BrkB family protein [Candidatus Dormibacteraeota bacterium]|nr:YihY/virulence factor BrkB family protein [Candidatus Dormibacteraeota bacterium]
MSSVSARGTTSLVGRGKHLVAQLSRLLPVRVALKFAANDGPSQAILIAWNALFSLFPIALALAAIIGFVLGRVGMNSASINNLIVSMIPNDANAQNAVLSGLNGIEQNAGELAVVAAVGFFWSASGLFGAMEQAFDRIFDCPRRGFLAQKVMSVAMMAIFTVLALLAVGVSALPPLLRSVPDLPPVLHQGTALFVYQIVFGTIAGFVLFLVIYVVVPNRSLRPLQVLPGAVLAGVGFELLTLVFPLYLHFNRGINQYGSAFALLFVLMFFFYFVGIITVLGAVLISVLSGTAGEKAATLDRA